MNGLYLTVAFSASSYICSKIANYCCTEPETRHSSFVQSIKNKGHRIQKWCESLVGVRAFSIFSDIVIDNAWISILVMGILLSPPHMPLPVDNPITRAVIIVGCGVVLCVTAWATRAVISVFLPMACEILVNVISPKPLRGSDDILDGIDEVFQPPGVLAVADPLGLQPNIETMEIR